MERGKYPLEWLDLLITVTLNPSNTDVSVITEEQAEHIESHLREEILRLQSLIKGQVFSINKENEIDLLIKQYHASLIALLDQTIKNQRLTAHVEKIIQNLNKAILANLDELFSFLETRFSKYISLDERVPATYFDVTKHELKIKVDRLWKYAEDNQVAKLLLKRLTHFVTASTYPYELTFRVVLYLRELINGLEEIDWIRNDREDFSQLEQLLIYMNFNSKKFMNILTDRLAKEVNRYEQPVESLMSFKATEVHDGYFSQDKAGKYKDTKETRTTKADDDTFNLIMRDKERLLDEKVPLRFIFSETVK